MESEVEEWTADNIVAYQEVLAYTHKVPVEHIEYDFTVIPDDPDHVVLRYLLTHIKDYKVIEKELFTTRVAVFPEVKQRLSQL